MHVAPENMRQAIEELWRVTKKYLLVIEYYSPEETWVDYRGNSKLLWKRDYSQCGRLLLESGELSKADGFDGCTYWLFRR